MTFRGRFAVVMALACLTGWAMLICARAAAESGRDLLLASEGTPGMSSILGPGGASSCDRAQAAFGAIPGAEGRLNAAQKQLAAAQAEEKDVLARQKSVRAGLEKKLSDAEKKLKGMRENRAGKKFGSALELAPEKSDFLRKLEEDIRQTESVAGQLGKVPVRIECPRGTSADVCSGAEREQRQLVANINGVLGSRLKILTGLKACVGMALRFFECRPLNVSCPASGFMGGVSLGGARAEFDRAYKGVAAKMKMSGDGDICRLTQEDYEFRLREYRKKYAGTPETSEEHRENAIKAEAESKLSRLDAELKPATEKTAAARQDVVYIEDEIARLKREHQKYSSECSSDDCRKTATTQKNNWEIDARPQMPEINETAESFGEWRFKLDYKLKNGVDCGLDLGQTGNAFGYDFSDSTRYSGGDYSLTFRRKKCQSDQIRFEGQIRGVNPEPSVVQKEIKRIFGGTEEGATGYNKSMAELALKIACQESGQKQFESGMPYFGAPHDYGMFQISDGVKCVHAWNWIENIKTAKRMWGDRFDEARRRHHKSENNPDYSDNSELIRCLSGLSASKRKNRLPPELSSSVRKWAALVKVYGKERISELAIEFNMSELEVETLKRYNGGRGTYFKITDEESCSGSWELRSQQDYDSTDYNSGRDAKKFYVENVLSKSTECSPDDIFDNSVVKSKKVLKTISRTKVKK